MVKSKDTPEQMVVVVTEFKEIFCGYAKETGNDWIELRNARQAVYYSAETHGLLGLAATGPAKGSRIGPPANVVLRKVVIVIECSQAAADAWEAAKWAN